MKIIKKSDYRVVDQLHQTPAKISILSLLIKSEAHWDSLMKVLSSAYIAEEISVNQFDNIVANLTSESYLGFSNNEFPPHGQAHNKALHITMQISTVHLSRVLTDTDCALNVLPNSSLIKLTIDDVAMRPSFAIVKAFDGSRSSVLGEVDLPVKIGPYIFNITFQVMDIELTYTCLLGRPWIHAAGAVTSTLHLKLKFFIEGRLVIIDGEEDIFVSHIES